ncbi:hypothetical protein ACFUMH_06170 [Cellulomonas sp. NPDC057328]|uniref:hypothetical protein n=1 Tax=Cellulomonas sp. NPDC057328 TaxID=3346101 RepID=UPI0036284909
MDASVVELERLDLRDDRELLSPPWLAGPLYRCATAVTVWGFLPHAVLDVEVDGAVVVAGHAAGFPEPQGERVPVPALEDGQEVRVRQHADGRTSDWSPALRVRDHTVDFPAGPPRPQVNPAPVWRCGSRTGVGNLLGGANVWITADGTEVGRVDGCSPQQGVDVNPFYAEDQKVRAHTELCGDPASPSVELTATARPGPLPAPAFDPVHDGAEQIRVTGVVNGARVTVLRGASSLGTFRCWGGSLMIGVAAVSEGEGFSATQELCPDQPGSPPGTTTVQPCSALGAPAVGPVQAGDTALTITSSAPGAVIRVYRNLVAVGVGTAPVVPLGQPLVAGDVVHVTQSLTTCPARVALQLTVACVDPPVAGDPAALDLVPVGRTEYADGPVRGSIHYPAEDDGVDQPFHRRLAERGPVPVVVMAHGNHSAADPSYLGYDYFQTSLAKAGIVAVSVDCNALNGPGGSVRNIEERADLVIDTIRHLQTLDATPGSTFHGRLDFSRVGLMGHSRGGEAVVMVPAVMGAIGVTVRAVLALAPTNFRYWERMPTLAPAGYAFSTILPASDGDVRDNNGAQLYDVARPEPFASQVYVHSTNHNFFNRRWAGDDGVTPVFSRGTHERVLDVYGSALFRGVLLGDGSEAYLLGTVRPVGVPVEAVDLAYRVERADTVDDHDDGNGIGTNSFGLPTSATGVAVADEFRFEQVAAAFNGSFFGLTTGMVLRSRERGGGDFRSEIGTADLTSSEVWVRVAEVVEGGVVPGGVSFDLGLEDWRGTVAWIGSASVGGVPRPFERPDRTKTMLSTLRFRPSCIGRRTRLDLSRVVAVHLRTTTDDDRPVAFDDLQLVPV